MCLALHGDSGSRGKRKERLRSSRVGGSPCEQHQWPRLEPLPEGGPSKQGRS